MRRLAWIALLFAFACRSRETGDSDHTKQLFTKYGCVACHQIPGIDAPHGAVGPSLDKLATRTTIAGHLPNTPQTMIQWLQNPQSLNPQTSMPNVGVTPADARDMTAYLDTLK